MESKKIQISPPDTNRISKSKLPENKMETAVEFERIFARHLVQEMTKGLFEAPEGQALTGRSASMYREYITGTLAQELAREQRLGMAELIINHWDAGESKSAGNQKEGEI